MLIYSLEEYKHLSSEAFTETAIIAGVQEG